MEMKFINNSTPNQKEGEKMKGTVKWYNARKGYGFILAENGDEVFVHYSAISPNDFKVLYNDESVEFNLIITPEGKQATNVKTVDPREIIVNKILNEFDIKIPFLSWAGIDISELMEYYEDLKRTYKNINK